MRSRSVDFSLSRLRRARDPNPPEVSASDAQHEAVTNDAALENRKRMPLAQGQPSNWLG